MKKTCEYCGVIFQKPNNISINEMTQRRFCSRLCKDTAQVIKKVCKNCGVIFTGWPKYFCGRKCHSEYVIAHSGRRISCITCGEKFARDSRKRKYCSLKCAKLAQRQAGHWNWKGGTTAEAVRIRKTAEYKDWHRAVLKRDNYTCQLCGQRGGKLEVDHKKSFAAHPKLRLDINNGRALCRPCHIKTPNYALKLNPIPKTKTKLNRSGHLGVSWNKHLNGWIAQLQYKGVRYSKFSTSLETAVSYRKEFEKLIA